MIEISRRNVLLGALGLSSLAVLGACKTGPSSTSSTGRLIVALGPPDKETNVTWEGLSQATNLQLRHCLEALIAVEAKTGKLVPGLAEKWEQAGDAKTWTVTLRKGVQFHRGYGEFTAADVVENYALTTQDGAVTSDAGRLRSLLGQTPDEVRKNIEVKDDHTVVFHLLKPYVDFPFMMSAKVGTLFMHSGKQLQKDGVAAIRNPTVGPVGTGPWEFVSRAQGQSMLFKKVPNHWRQTPDFDELELRFVPEAATMQAMGLNKEAHMVAVPRALQPRLVESGKKITTAANPSTGVEFTMGGVLYPGLPNYDASVPVVNPKVREAINRAVDRNGIVKAFFSTGGVQLMKNMSYYPTGDYWNSRWDDEFDSKYGYDPGKAKALLAEAGYPNGFDLTVATVSYTALPESASISETIAQNLTAIGLKVKLQTYQSQDVIAMSKAKDPKLRNVLVPWLVSYRPTLQLLQSYTQSGSDGSVTAEPVKEIDDAYKQLAASSDSAQRTALMQRIGDLKFDLYAELPLLWIPGQIVRDPGVVSDYQFPGDIAAVYSHFENARH
ncbi:ABC transporter substrate-binding protein [Dactylosporangium sp. CA-092794]|uniref:ABC transporter substrate-binding protein n=1 Tax=Dactylosporangium sp. CA-092794 TaxID=3239929 RepID=UPI003D9508F9